MLKKFYFPRDIIYIQTLKYNLKIFVKLQHFKWDFLEFVSKKCKKTSLSEFKSAKYSYTKIPRQLTVKIFL